MDPDAAAIAPVIGRPSFLVRQGYGSVITLEFGEPHLDVAEPRPLTTRLGDSTAPMMRRRVRVRGDWHLFVYMCAWSLSAGGLELAHSKSDEATIDEALRVLDGQALLNVAVHGSNGATVFEFDLGCVLTTAPYPPDADDDPNEPDEQWMLFQPSGEVFTVRVDGRWSNHPGNQNPDLARWETLPRAG